MSKISSMMDTGRRSMMNSQTALQTVGHNIANKTTEGFSRQRVEVLSNEPIGTGTLRIGMGARAALVTRVNNPYLEKQLQNEGSSLGEMRSRAESMGRVEQIYNEQVNKGLNQYMSDFFNAFRELSNNPESLTTRSMVKETSVALVNDFHRVDRDLNASQEDLSMQIRAQVEEINQITKEIASLNEKVQSVELQGVPANDERDRRDLLLKKLNEKIGITWGESKDGQVSVTAGHSAILVSGYSSRELKTSYTNERDRVEILYSSTEQSSPLVITDQIKGGSIGGALDIRDQFIEDLKSTNNELANQFAIEVNKAHIEGVDKNGKPGVLFFDLLENPNTAAKDIQVNTTILQDVKKIAAGVIPGANADNTVANVIADLQYKKTMKDGEFTFDDFYKSQVGDVGVIAQRAVKSFEAQQNIYDQLNNLRESISGVSLDEETTRMLEFQKAFEAAARLIRTADEMLDTVLNLKRI